MQTGRRLFTSESVTEGHPDKVCDQIADAVLDAILEQDPGAHVACEVMATTGMLFVTGEISTGCYVEIPAVARQVVRDIGYDSAEMGFDGNTCAVLTSIDMQSPDIAMGVNESFETKNGASDEDDEAQGQEDADRALYEALAADARKTEEDDAASALESIAAELGELMGESELNGTGVNDLIGEGEE